MRPVAPGPPVGPTLPLARLDGCRVVLAGFGAEAGRGLVMVFQTAGANCRTAAPALVGAAVRSCDLLVVWPAGLEECRSLLEPVTAPVIAAVSPGNVAEYLPWLRQTSADCIFYPCSETEILTRAVLAVDRRQAHPGRRPDGRFRILLADDDRSITALLKATLESDRMVCRCVGNGIDALKIAREWEPDLAVLDVNMPGMDGYQTLAALRQERKAIPVLLLTGCDQESEIMKGLKLGAADYVVKPFNPMEILMRVKRIVSAV
jgi:CheY-like chemotaxis protein